MGVCRFGVADEKPKPLLRTHVLPSYSSTLTSYVVPTDVSRCYTTEILGVGARNQSLVADLLNDGT